MVCGLCIVQNCAVKGHLRREGMQDPLLRDCSTVRERSTIKLDISTLITLWKNTEKFLKRRIYFFPLEITFQFSGPISSLPAIVALSDRRMHQNLYREDCVDVVDLCIGLGSQDIMNE